MRLPFSPSNIPRSVWIWAAAIVAAALVLTAALLVLRFHNIAASRQSVDQLMSRADQEISGGFYSAAKPYVERAMRSANTRDSWLSIGKRAFQIGNAQDDWSLLLQVADKGTKNLPGSQELWAIKVLAESRSGDPAAGEETARNHLTDPRFQSLGTEAVLRAHPDLNISGQSLSKTTQQIIDTLTSRNPALFQNLATEIQSPDLLFDAVLLYAWKGDMKAAYTLLVSQGDSASSQAGMLISYDAGQYESVRSYYEGMKPAERTPSFELLADDVLVLQQQYDDAASAYLRFIAQKPDAFWMPYVDLAWLASDGKSSRVSPAQAEANLVKASNIFPNQREVVLSLATLQRRTGELQSADTLLSAFLKSNPWDLDANLLYMQISGASQNPERLRSRLWELFYRAQGGSRDKIGSYLAWYLLGLDDYSGLQLLFSQVKNQTGSEWIPFFRGIYEALVGNYSSSVAELNRANAITGRWQTYYNLGIVDLKNGDPTAAVSDLQQADSSLTSDNESLLKSPQRARIHVALAQALSSLDNIEAAKREALYALDMDKNNLSAGLLLKKLDSTVQK
ncbi:MAG TPA: hypothetical protein VMW69_08615 [Spirochaetia bacterium]|nr:hypothetical protein [Spirochaetia bacterium]